jgi:hypothetical protein
MLVNKLKSVVLAATTIAVAMSVGFAAPASASVAYLTSSAPTISRGETITFSTDQDADTLTAVLINGEVLEMGPLYNLVEVPAPWEAISPCVTIDVTFRVYAETYDVSTIVLASDPFLAEANIEWIGDNTVDCNDLWGAGASTGSTEPLATTGSDASTVAGLTGVAGVVALAVAVAVARRTRRAQR